MSRTCLLALPILLAMLANTAAADDRDLCNDAKADREKRLAACANAIATNQWSETELAACMSRGRNNIVVSVPSTGPSTIAMRR